MSAGRDRPEPRTRANGAPDDPQVVCAAVVRRSDAEATVQDRVRQWRGTVALDLPGSPSAGMHDRLQRCADDEQRIQCRRGQGALNCGLDGLGSTLAVLVAKTRLVLVHRRHALSRHLLRAGHAGHGGVGRRRGVHRTCVGCRGQLQKQQRDDQRPGPPGSSGAGEAHSHHNIVSDSSTERIAPQAPRMVDRRRPPRSASSLSRSGAAPRSRRAGARRRRRRASRPLSGAWRPPSPPSLRRSPEGPRDRSWSCANRSRFSRSNPWTPFPVREGKGRFRRSSRRSSRRAWASTQRRSPCSHRTTGRHRL